MYNTCGTKHILYICGHFFLCIHVNVQQWQGTNRGEI